MFNEDRHHKSVSEALFGWLFPKEPKPLSDEEIEARYKLAKESHIMKGYHIVKDGNGMYKIEQPKNKPPMVSLYVTSTRKLSKIKLEYSKLFGKLTGIKRSQDTTRID